MPNNHQTFEESFQQGIDNPLLNSKLGEKNLMGWSKRHLRNKRKLKTNNILEEKYKDVTSVGKKKTLNLIKNKYKKELLENWTCFDQNKKNSVEGNVKEIWKMEQELKNEH